MTPLTTPQDTINYVPLATYVEQGRALEMLQDTARAFQEERTELQRELDLARYERNQAETDTAVALQLAAELRVALAESMQLLDRLTANGTRIGGDERRAYEKARALLAEGRG